jgi:hypothetical protein
VKRPGGLRAQASLLVVVALLLLTAVPAWAQELGPVAPDTIGPVPPDDLSVDAPLVEDRPEGAADGTGAVASDVARMTVTALTGVLGQGTVPVTTAEVTEDADADDPPDTPEPLDDLEVRVVVENLGELPLDGLRLTVEVHDAVGSRADLRAALDGGPLGQPAHVHDTAVGSDGTLGPAQSTVVRDVLSGPMLAWPDQPGVHPVRLALVRGTTVIASVTSAVVWLPEPPETPLPFAFVLPFTDVPWRTTGGSYPEGVDRGIQAGGRLDTVLGALERHPGSGVALAPAAHLLEALADRADGFLTVERSDSGNLESREQPSTGADAVLAATVLERLREVAATLPFEPVSGPYADADLTALQAGEAPLPDLAAQAATDGRRRLQRSLGRSVDAATTVLYGAVAPAVLDLLPGEVVVLPYEATARPDPALGSDLGPTVAALRSPAGRRLLAVVGDPYLDAALSEPDPTAGPVVAAQRVLAETALVHLTATPGGEDVLAAVPSLPWRPESRFLDVLLPALAEAAWLQPLPPSQLALAASVPTTGTPLELRGPAQTRFPGTLEAALATAARDLEAARNALPPDDRLIDGREAADLRDQLLRATSTWLSNGAIGEADSLVRDVQRAVDASFGDVEVAASGVTLTSDEGPVPITLHRARGGPLVVQVEVTSPGRLRFPEGSTSEPILLEAGGSETVAFPVAAVSTGSFPLTVRVTDPSGGRELARTVVPVRSTAVSGPALAGIGVVVLALLLAGARRRPDRRPPVPGPELEQDPPAPHEAPDAEAEAAASSRSVPWPHTVPTSDGSS